MNRAASYFRGLEFDIVTDRGDEDHETRYDTFARIGANWYLVCSCSLWTSGPRWEAEFSQAIAQLPALPNEVRRGTFASGPATEAEKQADAATLKRCAICGEYQSGGAIGAAGIHWGNPNCATLAAVRKKHGCGSVADCGAGHNWPGVLRPHRVRPNECTRGHVARR
jgi:hypothetical protein